jgi:conjugal transfer pilus assembly protein TraI
MHALRDILPRWARPGARDSTPSTCSPADVGIAWRPIDEILAPHEDLLARIKLSYGADAAIFDRELIAPIRRYAGHVHLLPATPDNFFSSPGGLLRMGLETAFFSLQATDGQIFSGGSTITSRRELEPRWRQACFIAGLCHELHRTVAPLVVTDRRGEAWPAYLLPLDAWLRERRADRFLIKWIACSGEPRSLGLFVLRHIVAPELLQHLASGNTTVVPHMVASIGGLPTWRDQNILDRLVRRATALVIDQDLRAREDRLGKPIRGCHLERYVVDAMRRLARDSPAWQHNSEKSRVWCGADGLFVVWPGAASDIVKLLEADQLAGMPKTPEAVLEVLLAADVIDARAPDDATWQIAPPGSRATIAALRLRAVDVLFAEAGQRPEQLSVPLLQDDHKAASAFVPPEPASASAAPRRAPPQPQADTAQIAMPFDLAPPDEPRAAPGLALRAPFKLNAVVATALSDIVATLDGQAEAAACPTPSGLFIPLAQFQRRHVDPGMAVRALADADMLGGGPSRTVVHEFAGEDLPGVIVSPRYITGFADVALADQSGA